MTWAGLGIRAVLALVPLGGLWNDLEVGSFPALWGKRKTMQNGCILAEKMLAPFLVCTALTFRPFQYAKPVADGQF